MNVLISNVLKKLTRIHKPHENKIPYKCVYLYTEDSY